MDLPCRREDAMREPAQTDIPERHRSFCRWLTVTSLPARAVPAVFTAVPASATDHGALLVAHRPKSHHLLLVYTRTRKQGTGPDSYLRQTNTRMTRKAPRNSQYSAALLLLFAAGLVDGLLGSSRCGRASSRGSPTWRSPPPGRRGTVSLAMGIRSLLKNKLLGRDPNDDDEETAPLRAPSPVPPAAPTRQSPSLNEELAQQQREIMQQKLTPAPLRMGEVSPGVVDATKIAEEESIQDKINRVKSGQMTEEEKRAFLATALSAGMTPESRKPLMKPKRDLERASASPFPSDSILRNFASGKVQQQKRDTSVSSVSLDLNTDAKKKEYLDMIMDPDRFTRHTKKAKPSTDASPPATTSWSQPSQENGSAGRVDDLGARLGVYAMEEEVRRQEAEKQRQQEELERAERERRRAIQKQEAEQHAAEVARRQQQVLLQAEEEKRRKDEEEERKRREAEKVAEQQRLQALIQQQEAYWTERLTKEREAKAKRELALMQASKMKDAPSGFDSSSVMGVSLTETNQPTIKVDVAPVQAFSDAFNPNEMNLLDEAKHDREVDWERNQKAIEWGAAHTPGTTPPPPSTNLQTEPDFLEEQYRKKAEIDRAREEQFLRLKELNSPLPAPVAPAPAPAPASRPSSLFRQPQSVPTAYRPTKSTIQDIQEAKKNAERHQQQDALRTQSQAATNRPNYAPVPPRPQVPAPSPAAWSSAGSGGTGQTWSSPYGQSKGDEKPQQTAPTPVATDTFQERKGPIRMQLPLGDAAADDDDGVDVRASTGMSIADAMRNVNRQADGGTDQNKRSKQWGIDMSRFRD